jgi:hypothetical protein
VCHSFIHFLQFGGGSFTPHYNARHAGNKLLQRLQLKGACTPPVIISRSATRHFPDELIALTCYIFLNNWKLEQLFYFVRNLNLIIEALGFRSS